MRRRPDLTDLPAPVAIGTTGGAQTIAKVAPVGAAAIPVAIAAQPGVAPHQAEMTRSATILRPAATANSWSTATPPPAVMQSTNPFPTPVDPFPPVADPFPPVANPFPPFVDPFPPFVDPFVPRSGPPTTPSPTVPSPTHTTITLAELDVSDKAINGPAARTGGLSGAGIKIGVISDSFGLAGGVAADEAAGLLPASGVTVLQDGASGNDEGRAMAELVHATAPNAQIYFHTSGESPSDMAAAVAALQAAGCQIIVDDVYFSDEPMFQIAGPIDTAIDNAMAGGVDYFAAEGNYSDAAYQAACVPELVNIAGLGAQWAQTFGGATTQGISIAPGGGGQLSLEWDANYDGDNTNPITAYLLQNGHVVSTSGQVGTEPVSLLDIPESNSAQNYQVAIVYSSSTPPADTMKFLLVSDGAIIDSPAGGESTGAVFGHGMLPGVNATGAIDVTATPSEGGTPEPEGFVSTGGSEFLLAPDGTPLSSPVVASAPDFLAPDGAQTSTLNPFFGTSAAAPVVGATAALMLQANPLLTESDITTLLEDTALPVASVLDQAGAGLIQANLATAFAKTGIISGSPSEVVRGTSAPSTIQGSAANQWIIAGSGNTLIQTQGVGSVQAGAGADTVDLTGAQAALYGSTGTTLVRTMDGNDTIIGGAGALTVLGGAGGGVIYGSTGGDDVLIAGQQQTIILARGPSDIVAGIGDGDLLYAANGGQDTITGGAGTEILVGGTGGTDVFVAGNGAPLIASEGANAVITLGTNNATVLEGTASNVLQVTSGLAGGFDAVYDFDASKDMLLLTGYNEAAADTAIADQYDTGGNSWVKLSDGTVMAFVGLGHLSASNVTFG